MINRKRIQRDIETLATMIDPSEQGFTRLSFSTECYRATEYVAEKMSEEAGLVVKKDAVGNLIGKRMGKVETAPSLMVGSHLDTVKEGGRYDGVVGVVAGLEIARCLRENDVRLDHPFEVVAFLAEEPSPFGRSTIGSRAMTGKLSTESLKQATDNRGKTLFNAIEEAGGQPDQLHKAARNPGSIAAFWEMHIEQGPVLDQHQVPIGVVTGIVSIMRGDIELTGLSNHAGTTPMSLRKDALTAAAGIVTSIDAIARRYKGMVTTVGEFLVYPNFSNVIPGKVRMGLELRSISQADLADALEQIENTLESSVSKTGVKSTFRHWLSSPRVRFPESMIEAAQLICGELGYDFLSFPSGAGHDASYLADIAPTGMIFVPSKGGLSHCPAEYTEMEDIGRGVEVLAGIIRKLDKSLAR